MISRGDYQNLEEFDEQFSTEIHSKVTWDHIQNLDKFFSNIYYFHQQHGFYVTFIEFLLQILKFFFIIWITSVFCELCFTGFLITKDQNFHFLYLPIILKSTNTFTNVLVVISYLLLGLFIINSVPKLHQFYSISKFYRDALKIRDDSIPDKTWFEILKSLIDVQKELPLCVHKPMLTELDIYHRILRRQNYLVAMMNQDKFPTEIKLPLFGSFVIVTKYYLDSIKYMLFKFPFKCPFGDHWQLRSDYKKLNCRTQLIAQLDQIFVLMGLIQLLISPICFLYLLITKACTYGHSFKLNPSHCVNREITPYGRVFLAHFNELPHEFSYRISKAYAAANQYLDSFTSKILVSIARLLRFLSGGIIIIGFVMSMVDSKFLFTPNVITVGAIVTFIYSISLKLIPDESVVVNPQLLLLEVQQHVHYVPDDWKDWAHTRKVYSDFSQLFQPKIIDITKELFSCFWTPLVFIAWMPRYSASIVDFLRNFTVDMHGVGDICSYAQTDLRKHGSPAWAVGTDTASDGPQKPQSRVEGMKYGKVELSLVNFYTNNPNCPLDESTRKFISDLKSLEAQQQNQLQLHPHMPTINNHMTSLSSIYHQPSVSDRYHHHGNHHHSNQQQHWKNASRLVGPMPCQQSTIRTSAFDNGHSNAIDNYFHSDNIPSLMLSHNSVPIDNYKSHHESIRELARSDINVSIHTLHVIHERRRMGLPLLMGGPDRVISEEEREDDSYQTRVSVPVGSGVAVAAGDEEDGGEVNELDLSSLPAP